MKDRARHYRPKPIFEDDAIVVVDKPAGMFIHRAPGHSGKSLADLLAEDRPQMRLAGSAERPGVVHRLDRDTSGVVVLAKTKQAYLSLRRDFESHRNVHKTYLAVLHGAISPRKGSIETTIGRKSWDSKRMAVDGIDAKSAITHWETIGKSGSLALTEFVIETGRTHQIRVHAAHLGHPVAGDILYGDALKDRRMAIAPKRQLLHAVSLELRHPTSGEVMKFTAPPPPDIVYAR